MITEALFLLIIFGTPYVEPVWRYYCNTYSEYNMFVMGCFLSQLIGYFLGCLPYILLDIIRPVLTQRFKIQPGKYPSSVTLIKCTIDVLISFTTVILPMLIGGGFVIHHFGITRDDPLPSPHVVLIQICYFFLVEDYLNYWFHRWLHLPWLYNKIHSVHHKYEAPISISAAFAHPAEVVILAIPTFAGPVLIGPHLYTLMVWQTFRNWEAIDIHSGYEFPFSLKSFLPSYAGTKHHDYHHYMHSGNFASVFTWCDQLYGTDTGYQAYIARKRRKQVD